ncbi:Glycosyltransferase involved in cell wall bisynthesis [Hyella patelloides LEGE 07179]|uniref:Glycosyltransferase involved in cell wall bisynthesis n=1 Tax=Hyella patelloides LEGE 07179 TaxID=945734 RepID=A0A563VX04_9CYAN|nr:glycosyltransferase [Hyella patelloides]VEP15941.1 Glycosyltransferase involved in cell wall bisynthesis [Hyella patelloides LEGE 07179]
MKKVLCLGTAGKGGQDERRIYRLSKWLNADVSYYFVDRSISKVEAAKDVWRVLKSEPWDLVYQEGTGLAGGVNLILASLLRQQPYVISSGDPIAGFFRTTKGNLVGNIFEIYEHLLYRYSAGFMGWTPYLTGVAMRMGAPKAVTVEGAVASDIFYPYSPEKRRAIRQKLGIPENHLVCGVVGSLIWVPPQSYCYGYELVEILKRVKRDDISFLIVGDGDGKTRMEEAVPKSLRSRIVFTGRLPESEVVSAMNAMDIGFVTLFGEMGNYRLTTKLPEYLGCGVPVAMNPTAGFYDYAANGGWALPEGHPSDRFFWDRSALWLDNLSWQEVKTKKEAAVEVAAKYFDYEVIAPKFRDFMHRLLDPKSLNQDKVIAKTDEPGETESSKLLF